MSDMGREMSEASELQLENDRGLVCEGGGMRGIYVAGVLDVLGENGITFDGVAGVSAGAIHATSFLANQHGRSIRFYLAYSADPRFMGFRSWIRTGDFVNYEFCYHEIPEKLVPLDFEALSKSKAAFYLVSTDVETGKAYYYRANSDMKAFMEALRASASLPLVSRFVEFDGRKLLDGGTADSIPVEFLRSEGYRRCVVVLTQVAGYRKEAASAGIFKMKYGAYPAYVESARTRHERYNATLDEIEKLEKAGEIFVFRPSEKIKIKRLERDTSRILNMYELGRRDALERLEALKAFLSQKN